MISFIDNIGYNGPLPNFSRDSMTWEEMQTVSESNLDKGHLVYCSTDEIGWQIDAEITQETADQEVQTLEDLQSIESPEIDDTVWVVEEEKGFVWSLISERKGHYEFLGVVSNVPRWAKILNDDGSIAGKLEVDPIPDEFIDALDDDPPVEAEEEEEGE